MVEMVADGSGQWRNGCGNGGKQQEGGVINSILIWFNDEILIPTYFYSVPVYEIKQVPSNLLATC